MVVVGLRLTIMYMFAWVKDVFCEGSDRSVFVAMYVDKMKDVRLLSSNTEKSIKFGEHLTMRYMRLLNRCENPFFSAKKGLQSSLKPDIISHVAKLSGAERTAS